MVLPSERKKEVGRGRSEVRLWSLERRQRKVEDYFREVGKPLAKGKNTQALGFI